MLMKRWLIFIWMCVFLLSAFAPAVFNPFASRIIDISLNAPHFPAHLPAPGQWVNNPFFNDPCNALGALSGGGSATPNNDDVVSLGGFGGQVVLAFDHDVEDSPANPMGLDAIVFSNAAWIWNNPQYHFSELATIEIMPELNGNTTAGDDPKERWYLIPGSHLSDLNRYREQNWDQTASGYPGYTGWPGSYRTTAHELDPNFQTINGRDGVLVNPNYDDGDSANDNLEGYHGYAEYTPSLKCGDRDGDNDNTGHGDDQNMDPKLFYTTPDDPMTVGITAGSGGGDAFDIQWALDPNTWHPANLSSFRYIRITTAVDEREFGDEGVLGEVSAEIDAVADVRPVGDINGDDEVDFFDLFLFTQSWLSSWGESNFNPAADLLLDNKVDMMDYALFAWGWGLYNSGL